MAKKIKKTESVRPEKIYLTYDKNENYYTVHDTPENAVAYLDSGDNVVEIFEATPVLLGKFKQGIVKV